MVSRTEHIWPAGVPCPHCDGRTVRLTRFAAGMLVLAACAVCGKDPVYQPSYDAALTRFRRG